MSSPWWVFDSVTNPSYICSSQTSGQLTLQGRGVTHTVTVAWLLLLCWYSGVSTTHIATIKNNTDNLTYTTRNTKPCWCSTCPDRWWRFSWGGHTRSVWTRRNATPMPLLMLHTTLNHRIPSLDDDTDQSDLSPPHFRGGRPLAQGVTRASCPISLMHKFMCIKG